MRAARTDWPLKPSSFYLFGRFRMGTGASVEAVPEPGKIQELLAYLLMFRERPHHRELLADVLFSGSTRDQSRKYLRQALWRLKGMVQPGEAAVPLLIVDADWVSLNPDANLWLDVAAVEDASAHAHGIAGRDLSPTVAAELARATKLYLGDLLEGWYQEWCIYERERLRARYLGLLDKLFEHAEAHAMIDDALAYGERILRHDRAHERTHVRMMRLHLLAGDRTAALRQFQICADVLDRELGVRPSRTTIALYEEARADARALD